MKIIGLMSGTSTDGLDVAYCEFLRPYHTSQVKLKDMDPKTLEHDLKQQRDYEQHYGNFMQIDGKNLYCNVFAATTYKYPASWREKLANLHRTTALEYAQADVDMGHFIGKKVVKFMSTHYGTVDLVASHGHTVFHQPGKGLTAQIGCGDAIAAETGLPVVFNFRALDVALGGQGAPLVPIGDRLLFGNYDACLNLGGIANISYDGKTKQPTHRAEATAFQSTTAFPRIAFDIAPCNMALNFLACKEGKEYDKEGAMARNGQIDAPLLTALEALAYYAQKSPKTLGKEWFEDNMLPLIDNDAPLCDTLRTVTEHIAMRIVAVAHDNGLKTILVTGGGAYNTFLMERLQQLAPDCELVLPHKTVIEFKEAIIFALLGYLRACNQENILHTATGAHKNCIAGDMTGGVVGA